MLTSGVESLHALARVALKLAHLSPSSPTDKSQFHNLGNLDDNLYATPIKNRAKHTLLGSLCFERSEHYGSGLW